MARSDATVWLERGLASVEALPTSSLLTAVHLRQFHGLWPSIAALARLWGEFDPARASGAMAALTNPLLRAVGRAAAMEFARWPRPDIAAALARAEADYLAAPQRSALDEATAAAVVEAIALAWCRHDADQLPAVHARLTLRADTAVGLWRAQVEQTAARTPLWPPEHLLSLGSMRKVLFEVDWALSENRRVRACLTLATRIRREEIAS